MWVSVSAVLVKRIQLNSFLILLLGGIGNQLRSFGSGQLDLTSSSSSLGSENSNKNNNAPRTYGIGGVSRTKSGVGERGIISLVKENGRIPPKCRVLHLSDPFSRGGFFFFLNRPFRGGFKSYLSELVMWFIKRHFIDEHIKSYQDLCNL